MDLTRPVGLGSILRALVGHLDDNLAIDLGHVPVVLGKNLLLGSIYGWGGRPRLDLHFFNLLVIVHDLCFLPGLPIDHRDHRDSGILLHVQGLVGVELIIIVVDVTTPATGDHLGLTIGSFLLINLYALGKGMEDLVKSCLLDGVLGDLHLRFVGLEIAEHVLELVVLIDLVSEKHLIML